MNENNLNQKYSEIDLSAIPGNCQLRYELLSPLFDNLYENKIIYHERLTYIATLENIKITPELFEATVVPCLLIKKDTPMEKRLLRLSKKSSWTIAAKWNYIGYRDNWLHAYSSWNMWCDPILV